MPVLSLARTVAAPLQRGITDVRLIHRGMFLLPHAREPLGGNLKQLRYVGLRGVLRRVVVSRPGLRFGVRQ
jgi:hypothetical protein